MKILDRLKKIILDAGRIIYKSFLNFFHHDSFMHGAALSYYALFAIPSILILGFTFFRMFFSNYYSEQIFREELFLLIEEIGGGIIAENSKALIEAEPIFEGYTIATAIAIIVLLVSATAVFSKIRTSLNSFWNAKGQIKTGVIKNLINRLQSILMMLIISVVMIVAFVLEVIANKVSVFIGEMFPNSFFSPDILNHLLVIFIGVMLFASIFKFLSDVDINIKVLLIGSLFTSILFHVGNIFVTTYLSAANFIISFGPGGSLMLVLLWVYYNSLTIYFGAHFTYQIGEYIEKPLRPVIPRNKKNNNSSNSDF